LPVDTLRCFLTLKNKCQIIKLYAPLLCICQTIQQSSSLHILNIKQTVHTLIRGHYKETLSFGSKLFAKCSKKIGLCGEKIYQNINFQTSLIFYFNYDDDGFKYSEFQIIMWQLIMFDFISSLKIYGMTIC